MVEKLAGSFMKRKKNNLFLLTSESKRMKSIIDKLIVLDFKVYVITDSKLFFEYYSTKHSDELEIYFIDFSQNELFEKKLNKILTTINKVDILINNFMSKIVPKTQNHESYKSQIQDFEYQVNYLITNYFISCKNIGNKIISNGGGVVLNIQCIGDISQKFPDLPDNISVAAVVNFTRYIATHWADRSVRSNSLIIYKNSLIEKSNSQNNESNDSLIGSILFLISNMSSYMTGSFVNMTHYNLGNH